MSLSDHVRVDIGPVVASTGAPTADGCVWLVTDVEGWDAPDMRGARSDPTAVAGSHLVGAMHGGRVVRVSGLVEAGTREDAWAAYYRCTGALPGLLEEIDLVVYESPTKFLTVRQAEPPVVTAPVNASFTFTLSLLAEYPFKRGTTAVDTPIPAGSSATITNSGTFAAEVKITTTGAGTVGVGAYGATLGTSASLPSGSVLSSIDRTIIDDTGADRYSLIATASQWLAVPVGSTLFTNTGTAPVVVSHYPTYA